MDCPSWQGNDKASLRALNRQSEKKHGLKILTNKVLAPKMTPAGP
jgi:hypothetical protein